VVKKPERNPELQALKASLAHIDAAMLASPQPNNPALSAALTDFESMSMAATRLSLETSEKVETGLSSLQASTARPSAICSGNPRC